MLKKLRNKKTAKKIWIVITTAIIVTFVFWGSESFVRNKQEAAFAGKIFGRKIPLLEYKDAFEAVRNEAIIQYGNKFSEVQKTLDLEYRAWERLVLLHEARKSRINVSDKEVIELIQSYPFFQRNGKFDRDLYERIVQSAFHTQQRIFEEQTRQSIVISKLYDLVTKDVTVNEEQVKEEYRKLNEDISVYYIAANFSDFAKNLEPAEKEIKDFFSGNQAEFKLPPSFNMDYIIADSEEKIKEAALNLNKRADLAKVAKNAGLTVKETGLFAQTDPIPGIGWSPEILGLISKLKVGQYTPPIRSDKNYYILRLKEIKESYIPDFEKVKDAAKDAFIKAESEKIAEGRAKECLEKLKELSRQNQKPIDFNIIAKDFGLKSDSTARFKFGSYIEGIGSSDVLWMAADELKNDNYSGLIRMPYGFYIIKIKELFPVDENKFASEKKDFSFAFLLQKKQERFVKFIEELKRRAQ